jgi:hypothetical protein
MDKLKDDIQFLKELQTELKTQEHDCQAAPRFWEIMDHEYRMTAEGYHDRVSVYDPFPADTYEVEEFCKRILDEEDSIIPLDEINNLKEIMAKDDYSKVEDLIEWIEENCKDVTVFYEKEEGVIKQNTMFLTKQEAKDHLEANSHHYSNKAHTYAMTAWRAPKVERLLKILETFDWDALAIDRGEGDGENE